MRPVPPVLCLPLLCLPLLCLPLLSGCSPWTAVAEGGSIMLFGRSGEDMIVSGITGRDCSVVRLAAGKTWCKPEEPPPPPPTFCTHSLGTVDCWSNPEALNGPAPHGVADGPQTLTPEQEANRTARWPNL